MDEPSVKIFVMGTNTWRDENEWPLARAVETPWFLGADGGLSRRTPRRKRRTTPTSTTRTTRCRRVRVRPIGRLPWNFAAVIRRAIDIFDIEYVDGRGPVFGGRK
ncbi:CocE/NonD family hydrolase C-terminal non-catalytic domain-containing protein [Kutzneria sp. 744]|uniref:CocE/NonD family hydrolase C-terminal non-catalytic domain-containing protein n=1 Tax=Kutzneria sp. (strain 744) TaxID=345341 RepID=UPI000A016338